MHKKSIIYQFHRRSCSSFHFTQKDLFLLLLPTCAHNLLAFCACVFLKTKISVKEIKRSNDDNRATLHAFFFVQKEMLCVFIKYIYYLYIYNTLNSNRTPYTKSNSSSTVYNISLVYCMVYSINIAVYTILCVVFHFLFVYVYTYNIFFFCHSFYHSVYGLSISVFSRTTHLR